jgi:HK97 family phage major capsid protein
MAALQFQLKGLTERRANIVAAVHKIGETIRKEERAMSADEKAAFEKLQADFGAVNDAMAAVNADLEAISAIADSAPPEPERSRPTPPARRSGTVAGGILARGGDSFGMVRETPEEAAKTRATVFKAWCRSQYDLEPTEEQESACERMGTTFERLRHQKEFVFRLSQNPRQFRDMGTATGAAGGFLVPQGFSGEFERFLLATSPLRSVARIIRTDGGNVMPYPTVSDTGNLGELLVDNATIATVDPTIAQVSFGAFKYGSRLIPVSFELMNDSGFDMESMIGELAGERIGRSQNAAFTTGTGTAQPQGVVTGATAGITTASATAIAATEVIRLAHAIDPAYRDAGPSVGYMMHDNIKLQLALLLDTQNRPLFVASWRDGEVDRVYGRPVWANQGMVSTIATTNITMLYGDFSKFVIRDAGEVRVRRLEERYADKDQTGFVAFLRSDSRVINGNAIKRLTQA